MLRDLKGQEMKRVGTDRSIIMPVLVVMVMLTVVVSITGCGHSGPDGFPDTFVAVEPDEALKPLQNNLEKLIFTEGYAGHLVVIFQENARARMSDEGKFSLSKSGDHDVLESKLGSVLSTYAGVKVKRTVEGDEAEIVKARFKLEMLSGKKLQDWNSIYHFEISNPNEAVRVFRELRAEVGIQAIYPGMTPYPSSMNPPRAECGAGSGGVPLLECHQGYLKAQDAMTVNGRQVTVDGLNAIAAWNTTVNGRPIRGEGVDVIVVDLGMNFAHRELQLNGARQGRGGRSLVGADCWLFPINGRTQQCDWSDIDHPDCELQRTHPGLTYDCALGVAHGTAVGAMLVGKDESFMNGQQTTEPSRGVTGFAPDAQLYYSSAVAHAGSLRELTVSNSRWNLSHIESGSIWLIEVQRPGPTSSTGRCYGGDGRCLPIEAWHEDFKAIEDAIAYGVTVITGAGNSGVNLDNDALYDPNSTNASGQLVFRNGVKNLRTEDSGSILVAASWGPAAPQGSSSRECASWSNYGRNVDAFAWGSTTATAGRQYSAQGTTPLFQWNNTGHFDPTNNPNQSHTWYVNDFSGTSSAAAMVAGAAVLVQSYAKEKMSSANGRTRFLMPPKMKELLVGSGLNQQGRNDCNIGKQPRVDVAMQQFDTFWTRIQRDYPQLTATNPVDRRLPMQRFLDLRRIEGIGLKCVEGDTQFTQSDPSCPAAMITPPGSGIGKTLDIDADGRGDLVSWTNGSLKIDFSSVATPRTGGDKFGEWDVDLSGGDLRINTQLYEPWPYFIDMNSDGQTDIVLYDKENGRWYIKFIDVELLAGHFRGWDRVVDFSRTQSARGSRAPVWGRDTREMDPMQSKYSRPVPGDYNADGWVDIAIAASDGWWRISYGGKDTDGDGIPDNRDPDRDGDGVDDVRDNCAQIANRNQEDILPRHPTNPNGPHGNGIGDACDAVSQRNQVLWQWSPNDGWGEIEWDFEFQYLDDTRLYNVPTVDGGSVDVPGWAYLPIPVKSVSGTAGVYMNFKVPDGLGDAGSLIIYQPRFVQRGGVWFLDSYRDMSLLWGVSRIFGGNERIPVVIHYEHVDSDASIGLKSTDGYWRVSSPSWDSFLNLNENSMFGGMGCHPLSADFDGDNRDDRAVQCPDKWVIAYSSGGVRHIPELTFNTSEFTLPGRSYSGGVSYSRAKELIRLAQELNPNQVPPVPVDMVTINSCLFPDLCQ